MLVTLFALNSNWLIMLFVSVMIGQSNRPFSKMAARNSNKLKLKAYTSTRKSTFTLVTLQSFSISGVISVEKCKLKNEKFTDVCMTGGMTYTPSHTNICKFVNFHVTLPELI